MHSGPITLPDTIKEHCDALLNLAVMTRIFLISDYVKALDVQRRVMTNNASIIDLQKIIILCDMLSSHEVLHEQLKKEIKELKNAINMFITVASMPTRPCGLWVGSVCSFNDESDM